MMMTGDDVSSGEKDEAIPEADLSEDETKAESDSYGSPTVGEPLTRVALEGKEELVSTPSLDDEENSASEDESESVGAETPATLEGSDIEYARGRPARPHIKCTPS